MKLALYAPCLLGKAEEVLEGAAVRRVVTAACCWVFPSKGASLGRFIEARSQAQRDSVSLSAQTSGSLFIQKMYSVEKQLAEDQNV